MEVGNLNFGVTVGKVQGSVGSNEGSGKAMLNRHSVSVEDHTNPTKRQVADFILGDRGKITHLLMAADIKTAEVKNFVRALNKKTSSAEEKKKAAEHISEYIIGKELSTEQSCKIKHVLRPELKNNLSPDTKEDSKGSKENKESGGVKHDQVIAKVECEDGCYTYALDKCEHTVYNQSEGVFRTHIITSKRYGQTGSGQRQTGLLSPEANRVNIKTDSTSHINCRQLDLLLTSKIRFESNHPYKPKFRQGDDITRIFVEKNTFYAACLYNVALCVDSTIRRELKPEDFTFLSVQVKAGGYNPVRMLNIKSAFDENKNKQVFESEVLNNSERFLVDRGNNIGNQLVVQFSDLETLTDFAESKGDFDSLLADNKIEVSLKSPYAFSDEAAENCVERVKATLKKKQDKFKQCDSNHNVFWHGLGRQFSEMSTMEKRNFARTFCIKPSGGNELAIYDMEKPVKRQLFTCNGCEFTAYPEHDLNSES